MWRTWLKDGKPFLPWRKGTILIVPPAQTIEAWQSTTFELDFNGQVPAQIRRSGRNNAEGVRFHDAMVSQMEQNLIKTAGTPVLT
jgi:hypothetical protein